MTDSAESSQSSGAIMIKRNSYTFALLLFLLLTLPSLGNAENNHDECIKYYRKLTHVNIIEINLECGSLKVFVDIDPKIRKTTSEFTRENRLIAAINGDYPRYGLHINNGAVLSQSFDKVDKSFFACNRRKECFIEKTDLISLTKPDWEIAIGGWQSLSNGRFSCPTITTKPCKDSYANKKHPRTAIGLDRNKRKMYFIVVEGRLPEFSGMTLDELSDLFRYLEIPEGLNLDGGGSSTMIYRGTRVNRLPMSQDKERSVISHIGIADESSNQKP